MGHRVKGAPVVAVVAVAEAVGAGWAREKEKRSAAGWTRWWRSRWGRQRAQRRAAGLSLWAQSLAPAIATGALTPIGLGFLKRIMCAVQQSHETGKPDMWPLIGQSLATRKRVLTEGDWREAPYTRD